MSTWILSESDRDRDPNGERDPDPDPNGDPISGRARVHDESAVAVGPHLPPRPRAALALDRHERQRG